MGCQKHFTKMENTQLTVKPTNIGKRSYAKF